MMTTSNKTRFLVGENYHEGQKLATGHTVSSCQYCAQKFATKRPDIAKFCCDQHRYKLNNFLRGKDISLMIPTIQGMKKNDNILKKYYPESLGEKPIPVEPILAEGYDKQVPYTEDMNTLALFYFDYGISFFRDKTAIIYRADSFFIKHLIVYPWL